jgi:hypothetical protein
MPNFENVRSSYRPTVIATLFVGESAPYGGTFFYNEDSGLFREMRKAFRGSEFFLDDFKRSGFYLDDLVLEPVNHLQRKDRMSLCRNSVTAFAKRLKSYKPRAVVILLKSIKPMVLQAMREARLPYEPFCTPYPGMGNQPRFHKAMIAIIPNLPTATASTWKEHQ